MQIAKRCLSMIVLTAIITIALTTVPALAREWTILGPRALGMGGAHVAVANDATAGYWNPAAYGFIGNQDGGDYAKRDWSVGLSAGAGISIHEGIGEMLDEISNYDFDELGGQIQAEDVDNYIQLLSALKKFDENENRAVKVTMNGQLGAQVGHFGIAGINLSEISAKGDIDTVNILPETGVVEGDIINDYLSDTAYLNGGTPIGPGYTYSYFINVGERNALINSIANLDGWDNATAKNFVQAVDNGLSQVPTEDIPDDITTDIQNVAQIASDAQKGGSFDDNDSKLLFKGISVFEVPLTYGYAITEDFAVGGNFKFMKARTYNVEIPVFDTEFEDALDDAQDDYLDSSNFGIDLGMLYRFGDDLRIGIVGRNLNSPKFDMKNNDSIKEKFQLRAGICYKPLSFLMLAADFDITKNDTTITGGYKSQNLSIGAELNLFKFLYLRSGAYKNIAESDIGLVYTAGLGLNFWLFNFDAGVSMASEKEIIDDDEYPREIKAEFALSMLF